METIIDMTYILNKFNRCNTFSLTSSLKIENLTILKEPDAFDVNKIIKNPQDAVLINNLIKYEYTTTTHCTKGPLQLVLYFKLNDETKNWLLRFKDDYALFETDFEDLAIYDNDKIKFSSCTHEGFNSLDSIYTCDN